MRSWQKKNYFHPKNYKIYTCIVTLHCISRSIPITIIIIGNTMLCTIITSNITYFYTRYYTVNTAIIISFWYTGVTPWIWSPIEFWIYKKKKKITRIFELYSFIIYNVDFSDLQYVESVFIMSILVSVEMPVFAFWW